MPTLTQSKSDKPQARRKVKIYSKLKNRVSNYLKKLNNTPPADVEYAYKDFSIFLPAGHLLPEYQAAHLKYDRFLPHFAKYIDKNATIIDVGANCGDTLAAMVETNPDATYVCIEPDDAFFNYLKSNIARIKLHAKNLSVHTVKSLVGKNVTNVSLEGENGSKHAVVGASTGGHTSRPLDHIISDLKCPPVKLLKSDVDGFDFDVIDSGENLLVAQHPIIFFECQCDFEYQKAGYEKTMTHLQSIGYSDWTVFDNFGEVMLRTNDTNQIFQLLDYVWKQNIKAATRTIHYYDILAASAQDTALIDKALAAY